MMAAEQLTSLHEYAARYARHGFLVFPVSPADKAPLNEHGMKQGTTDQATITRWWTDNPDALIGCRIPEDMIVLDIDPRHGGDTTWQALIDTYGSINTGRMHHSGRGDGGFHAWFKRPDGKLSIRALHDWARANGVGHPAGKNSWTSGIDLLHHNHRYTILPPSPHPETRRPYEWDSKTDPASLPPFMVQYVTTNPVPPKPSVTLRLADETSIADWFSSTESWNDILGPVSWVRVHGDGDSDGSSWRHPNATAKQSCTIKHGCLFVYTPNTDFEETEQGSPYGYTRFRAWAILEHNGDLKAAARAAFDLRDGPRLTTSQLFTGRPTQPSQPPPTGLTEAFWDERPLLAHIRQAARARLVAPAAVLGAILARVAAFTPPSTCLPPTIGGNAPLSLYIALRGNSGDGKSSPVATATDLIPGHPPTCIGPLALGTGEGLVEAFMDLVEESITDTNGKTQKRKVKKQVKHGALFNLDEGQLLSEIGARKGATILPVLRTAWSGGDPGQANASIETRRSLKPGTYAVGIISLWQDKAAVALLADADGGTPQRFVWLDVADPNATVDRPAWPGPLTWKPPPLIAMQGVISPNPLKLATAIELEIAHARVAHVRRDIITPPLDAHRRLNKLKVAGVLAVLDERTDITEDDWRLAEHIMTTSDQTRDWVIAEAQRRTADEAAGRVTQAVIRDAVVETSALERALKRAAKSVYRAVARGDGPVGKRQIHSAIASRDRQNVTVAEAIQEAERLHWVTPLGDGWVPGEAKPA